MQKSYTLKELSEITQTRLQGPGDLILRGVGALESAGEDMLSFLADPRQARRLRACRAGAVILPEGVACDLPSLVSTNPYKHFVQVVNLFSGPARRPAPGIHSSAVVDSSAEIAPDASVGPLCVVGARARVGAGTVLAAQVYVGEESTVGAGCWFYPHVVVREKVKIGDRVVLHPGVVIGADGFGFLPEGGRYLKIPQVGTVVIEDDVEIGANTTVDRAALGETRIGRGCKLDNLIMVAHNVRIGADTVLAGQCGISGSTVLGERVRVGGQAGCGGHLHIGNDAVLGGQSGVSKDVPAGVFVSGYPARPHAEALRIQAEVNRIPALRRQIRDLEARLELLEGKSREGQP